jgi:hypothetical protein
MPIALALASLLLTAAPTGSARLDQGSAGLNLRLTSFETEQVAVPKRGTFTSAELLFRSPTGERLDLRILYKGVGELPPTNVVSVVAQTAAGGLSSWTAAKKAGCRVKLVRAKTDEVAGKIDCRTPEVGGPFEAVFEAKR